MAILEYLNYKNYNNGGFCKDYLAEILFVFSLKNNPQMVILKRQKASKINRTTIDLANVFKNREKAAFTKKVGIS